MKKEEKEKWRRLDNSAKLFPIVGNKKFSSKSIKNVIR